MIRTYKKNFFSIPTTYGFQDKKIFVSKNGKGSLYRLIGRRAEVVLKDLNKIYKYQLNRKWTPQKPLREDI